ncbi:undecaprenyl-diphosphatase UppP [Candidatus Gracilibacteria bacterium]|nr:undecaprenyl-diphosphatase UppP [Candidatus Gracilibacteria bacterium]
MTLLEALILGIIQGISEFLPISSSGHLVLGEYFLGLDVSELKSFDVVVHVGTLLAILVYFWKDIWGLIRAVFVKDEKYRPLLGWIIVGTIPAVFVGLYGEEFIDSIFRDVYMVALAMTVMAVVFLIGEWVHRKRGPSKMNWWKALLIGVAQAVAIIPGVSRSGSTIVVGLFAGIKREEAARFSFLLGAPAIFGAGLLTSLKTGGELGVSIGPLVVGFLSAFIFGLFAVWGLMKFLKKHSLVVFAVYLLIVAALVWWQAGIVCCEPPVELTLSI